MCLILLIWFSYSRDTSLKLWDSTSLVELQSFGGHEGTISSVAFMTDKPFESIPLVLSASVDCSLRVWDMEKGNIKFQLFLIC